MPDTDNDDTTTRLTLLDGQSVGLSPTASGAATYSTAAVTSAIVNDEATADWFLAPVLGHCVGTAPQLESPCAQITLTSECITFLGGEGCIWTTNAAVDDVIEYESADYAAGSETKTQYHDNAHETILMIAAPVSLLVSCPCHFNPVDL